MPNHQPASPIPPDPGGGEDIMSAQPQDQDTRPDNRETPLLGPDTGGREDIMSAQPQDQDTDNDG